MGQRIVKESVREPFLNHWRKPEHRLKKARSEGWDKRTGGGEPVP